MSQYIKKVISVIFIAISISSCNGQNQGGTGNHSIECIKLNNEGLADLQNYPANGQKGLDKAINLFKQAIQCDSTNVVFYINLANGYGQKHNLNEALKAYTKILKLTKNDPLILMHKGMLFEVMGYTDSAKQIYHLTELEYYTRLTAHPDDIQFIKGIVLLKGVTNGKDEAVNTLNEQIKKHPKLSSELSQERLFYEDFDRENFIFGKPTITNIH